MKKGTLTLKSEVVYLGTTLKPKTELSFVQDNKGRIYVQTNGLNYFINKSGIDSIIYLN